MYTWEPHIPQGPHLWVIEASCCEEYVLCAQAAQYFVRRRADDGNHEETARGPYARAVKAWIDLAAGHRHLSERRR